MKKFIAFVFALLIFLPQAYATRSVKTYTPIGKSYNPYFNQMHPYRHRHNYYRNNCNGLNDLSAMEKSLFKRSYNNENLNSRLERLEENMYGRRIPGTISERYRNLSNSFVYNNPGTYYDTYSTNNGYSFYPPASMPKTSLWDKVTNYFTGTSTGLSPAMDGFYSEQFVKTPFGSGVYSQNKNYGTGSSVTILD